MEGQGAGVLAYAVTPRVLPFSPFRHTRREEDEPPGVGEAACRETWWAGWALSVTLRLVSPSTASSLDRRAARQRRDGMPSDVADGLDAVSIALRLCETPHRSVTRKKSREAATRRHAE